MSLKIENKLLSSIGPHCCPLQVSPGAAGRCCDDVCPLRASVESVRFSPNGRCSDIGVVSDSVLCAAVGSCGGLKLKLKKYVRN